MGQLYNFDLSGDFAREFPIFVETGYGSGNGVEYASHFEFERIYSIELYAPAVESGQAGWAHDNRVEIVEAASVDGIRMVLERHPGKGVFFWLDAHFPGADLCGQPWDAHPLPVRLPLEAELAVIAELGGRYAVLADDMFYYADLPYQWSLNPEWRHPRPLDFLTRFTATHFVSLVFNDKGYCLISPLGVPVPRMTRTE